MWSTSIRVLGIPVRIEIDDEATADTLAKMTSTYEVVDGGQCALRYRLKARPEPTLLRDGEVIGKPAQALDLPPKFELDLYEQMGERCDHLWLLHGAALASDQGAVVLIGPSGAGKSTLSMALVERGVSYITDELVGVDSELRVHGATRPICFTAPRPTSFPPAVTVARYPYGGPLGEHSALLVAPRPELLCRGPRELRHLVILEQRPGSQARMERLTSGEALCAVWDETLRQDAPAMSRATELVERQGIPIHRLQSPGPEEACSAIEELMAGVSPA